MSRNSLKRAKGKRGTHETQTWVEIPVTPNLVREFRLGVKREFNKSARRLAWELKISHTMLWMVERGRRPISEQLAYRIRAYYLTYLKDAKLPRNPPSIVIISRFVLPRRLEILAHPIKCDKCHRWLVPVASGQKRHSKCPLSN